MSGLPASASSAPDAARADWRIDAVVCVGLIVATLAIYWHAFGFGMVDLDDFGYVGPTSGPVAQGLSPGNVRWALTTTHMANWHPLTWLSLMLDRTIQPDGFAVFHIVNVALHVISSLLLYAAVRTITRAGRANQWAAALVAALFAVHPAHVESVAWISERKDVLSGLFWMLTLWAYARFVRAKQRRVLWYLVVLLSLALGLLAKPMLVTLPLVLLLLDYWPLRRLDQAARAGVGPALRAMVSLAIEKMPMLALAGASCAMTYLAQHGSGAVAAVSVRYRMANAAISYVRYAMMFIWPGDLAAIYPLPGWLGHAPWPMWMVIGCATAIGLISLMALLLWRAAPHFIVGWLWYVGTLVPVIGLFVMVGQQAIADRYTYLPFIGLSIALAWTLRVAALRSKGLAWVVAPVMTAALVLLAVSARRQVDTWRDSDTLFSYALAVTHDNYRAHEAWGTTLMREKRFSAAEGHWQACVDLLPTAVRPLMALSEAQMNLDKFASAAAGYRRVIELEPANAAAHSCLGWIAWQRGDNVLAVAELQRAVEIDPENQTYRGLLEEVQSKARK